MKKIFSMLLPFIVSGVFAQKPPEKIYGTVIIEPGKAMKMTEVTLGEWIGFIINHDFDSSLFPINKNVPPETAVIFDDLRKKESFTFLNIVKNKGTVKKYNGLLGVTPTNAIKKILHTDSNDFSLQIPITGISFEQAEKFCFWKEHQINQSAAVPIHIALPEISDYKKVLPDKDSLNSSKCPMLNFYNCNCITTKYKKLNKAQGKSLVRADSYWPSDLGLYNLQGNAAEMTATRSVAMGGSFRHPAIASFSNQTQVYSHPEDWLGFRYIVTLKR
jgi:formylglycine-generating enzyme required for sulfatase activity